MMLGSWGRQMREAMQQQTFRKRGRSKAWEALLEQSVWMKRHELQPIVAGITLRV